MIASRFSTSAASGESPRAMLKQNGVSPELLALVVRRQNLLHDAYVSTAGYQRPGIARGTRRTPAPKT